MEDYFEGCLFDEIMVDRRSGQIYEEDLIENDLDLEEVYDL